jgi:glycosyltransferase involved in cell wall biosynthesis
VLHVTALPPGLAYLPLCAARIEVMGLLPHADFLQEMVRMDVLLYASLTECYPMLLLEGMAAGVPVVVSRTHRVLEGDAVLQQALVVEEPDSPDAVRDMIFSRHPLRGADSQSGVGGGKGRASERA